MKNCTSNECLPSCVDSQLRPNFFSGQLVTAEDLNHVVMYGKYKQRIHNRFLHGWGVVCGLECKPGKKPYTCLIYPGAFINCCGDMGLINHIECVDLCSEDLSDPCTYQLDPWCREAVLECDPAKPLYITVCYTECQTNPVRVQRNGCGCETHECEFSQVRESYVIKCSTNPPENYPCEPPKAWSSPFDCPPNGIRDCPPCLSDPCVVLAKVTCDNQGKVHVDNSCRQTMFNPANWWLCCSDQYRQVAGIQATMAGSPTTVVSLSEPDQPLPEASPFLWRTPGGDRIPFSLPIDVTPGASTEEILAKYGELTFYHPAAGQPFTLRNLFASANLQLDETFENREALLHQLESEPVDLQSYLSTRAVLSELLAPDALDEIDAHNGGRLSDLTKVVKAKSISGATSDSSVAKAVGDRTIATLARLSRDSFVKRALENVSAEDRPSVEAEAKVVWTRAKRIASLT